MKVSEVFIGVRARILAAMYLLLVLIVGACSQAIKPSQTNDVSLQERLSEKESESATPFDSSAWIERNRSLFVQGASLGVLGTQPSLALGLYLMRAGKYTEARAVFKILLVQGAENAQFLYEKSRILECEHSHCSALSPPSSSFLQTMLAAAKTRQRQEHYRCWLGRALIVEGDIEGATGTLEELVDDGLSGERLNTLLLRIAPHWLGLDHLYVRADRLLTKLQENGNSFEAAVALKTRYDIARLQGNTRTATAHKLTLLVRYPATQMSLWPDLATHLAEDLSPAERFSRTRRLIQHFDYDNARVELRALAQEPKYRDEARWLIARTSMTNAQNPTESEEIYRAFTTKRSPRQEDAFYGVAQALSRRLDYRAALKALDVYAQHYPKGKYSQRVLYLRGWYRFDLRDNEGARPYLLEYAKKYNDTAVWGFYAWSFVREQRYKEAIAAFEELLRNSNPIVRGKALYWQAYCFERLGDSAKAQEKFAILHEEFPFTYYDILAFQREEEFYGKNYTQALNKRWRNTDNALDTTGYAMTPFGYAKDMQSASDHSAWGEIMTWISEDEVDLARALYRKHKAAILAKLEPTQRESFRAYATSLVEYYYDAWEDASGSVRAMSKIYPDRNSARQQMAFPRAFRPLVEGLEQRFGVPAVFIYAIMLQESRFRPWQVSSADAIGALQMIPKTARVLATELGEEYHPDQFFDPKVGFPYSALYMQKHLAMWHNNLTLTAGSYNGGPHRVGPWMLRDKGAGLDFLIEEFSFDESRHYARKVAEHCLRYTYLYEQSAQGQAKILEMLFPRTVNYDIPTDDFGI